MSRFTYLGIIVLIKVVGLLWDGGFLVLSLVLIAASVSWKAQVII